MRKVVEIVILDSEDAYKQEYNSTFVGGELLYLRGIQVLFDAKSFNHMRENGVRAKLLTK